MARSHSVIFIFSLFMGAVLCDLYLHNPSGSNCRLNEANTNRNNGNRLFDTQNNAKGGYCIGPQMEFYEGSLLSVEWTVQHGCGSNPKMICNMVLQYMCGSNQANPLVRIRDGVTTNTIPATEAGATDVTGTELTFGMHEPLQHYLDCTVRDRNMGLYIADRATQGGLQGNGRRAAIYTRQNNNGNRNGLECPEERDYYPYWHPSPWKDIAILTTDLSFCSFYRKNSQNVMPKGYCVDPAVDDNVQTQENNQKDCDDNGHEWKMKASWGISAPDCVKVPWSRENHLGNGIDGFANTYNMTIPKGEKCADDDDCNCVLRIRYNISTIEAGHPTMSNPDTGFIDSSNNGLNGSAITQNPVLVNPMNEFDEDGNPIGFDMKLAVDTTQFGRTFQDRTHTFRIIRRPKGVSSSNRIFNLNVRGKRGNIVQTYPSTEYDYVPQYLYTRVGDYIHFQWTGCDTNPAGNAGEGRDGTDRSNLVQIVNAAASMPATEKWMAANPKKVFLRDPKLRLRFATLDQTGCLTRSQLLAANGNNAGNAENDERNCGKLNAASPYFNGGLIRMNNTGTYHFMNTRNHNFSNRDQKGIVYVVPLLPNWAIGVVVTGAVLTFLSIGVAIAMFYAKQNPHSGVANLFSKF